MGKISLLKVKRIKKRYRKIVIYKCLDKPFLPINYRLLYKVNILKILINI
tara:strand:- start:19965 stop:20114 length:150 start_codon:yes stop_codon:yes gene_type:complete